MYIFQFFETTRQKKENVSSNVSLIKKKINELTLSPRERTYVCMFHYFLLSFFSLPIFHVKSQIFSHLFYSLQLIHSATFWPVKSRRSARKAEDTATLAHFLPGIVLVQFGYIFRKFLHSSVNQKFEKFFLVCFLSKKCQTLDILPGFWIYLGLRNLFFLA